MRHLKSINKYFWKYRFRLCFGIVFIILSNYFAILAPQLTGYIFDLLQLHLGADSAIRKEIYNYDPAVFYFIGEIDKYQLNFNQSVAAFGIAILVFALLSGFFMFLMRQTIIVMSRHIEFDQKNEVFQHYLQLDINFYKTHSTGDLMSRIAEDVSRVRMYTGPAIMYLVNLLFRISFCLFYMIRKDPLLTLYVLLPLPVLAITIYVVNSIIHRKSERIQALLASLTTNAQESYSGIRVIKSFVQENAMFGFFDRNSEEYKQNAIGLAKVESLYFPSMALLIGLSTLLTIMIGGIYAIRGTHGVDMGTIAEFVMYINMLTFPVSAIGWTASMIQRASASQKRLNEFLDTRSALPTATLPQSKPLDGNISFRDVTFVYPNTGIQAIKNFNLDIKKGQRVAIIGHTGSGKTTIAQLLLRMYDPTSGNILLDDTDIRDLDIGTMRRQISYTPQDVFLFSDTIANNISFGVMNQRAANVQEAAHYASIDKEIESFPLKYETLVGERGVTLSGGQKQRISIARALIKNTPIIVFDDCLSAVDSKTEKQVLANLNHYLQYRTVIIITHRILSLFDFDKIIVLDDGEVVEEGKHDELLARNGYYTFLYQQQQMEKDKEISGD